MNAEELGPSEEGLKAEPEGAEKPAADIIGKLIWLIFIDKRSLLFNRRSFRIFLRSP